MRKLRHRGKKLVNQLFLFTAAAYNLGQNATIIGVVR